MVTGGTTVDLQEIALKNCNKSNNLQVYTGHRKWQCSISYITFSNGLYSNHDTISLILFWKVCGLGESFNLVTAVKNYNSHVIHSSQYALYSRDVGCRKVSNG